MLDWFYLLIAGIAAVIVVFIVRAVRLTKASIAEAAPFVPFSQPEAVRRVVDRIRTLDVRCPQCGHPTVTILGTRNRYRCDDDGCGFEFEGPEHIAMD